MMTDLSNQELFKIITIDKDRLDPATVAEAEAEFSKRKVSRDEAVVMLKQHGVHLQTSEEYAKGKLSLIGKIVAFILPGLLYIFYIGRIRPNVFDRKAFEVRRWTLYGLGFYSIILIIVELLQITS